MYRRLSSAVVALSSPLLLVACGGGGSEAGGSASPQVVASAEMSTSTGGSGGGPSYLGPAGYGALKLGMKGAEAESAGLIVVKSEAPGGLGCGTFDLKEFPRKASAAGGSYSAELGVASIFAVDDMSTPEGIKIGSSAADAKKAYPKLQHGPNTSFVTVPGNPRATYGFLIINGRVKELVLDLAKQPCHN